MSQTKAICAACSTPLNFTDEGRALFCPTCGVSGSLDDVKAEVQSHIDEMHTRMLQSKAEDIGKAIPWISTKINPVPETSRRFISDLTAENYAERTAAPA